MERTTIRNTLVTYDLNRGDLVGGLHMRVKLVDTKKQQLRASTNMIRRLAQGPTLFRVTVCWLHSVPRSME